MTIGKLKIYKEEAKDRLTSHWDWDCMTTKELEAALLAEAHQSGDDQKTQQGFLSKLLYLLGLRQRP